MPEPSRQADEGRLRHLQRLGLVGVLFFLLKGVAWLSVPAIALVRGCD